MLKGYYSNLELAKIVANCQTIDELVIAGKALVSLHIEYEIIDIKFFELMAHKRIKRILN